MRELPSGHQRRRQPVSALWRARRTGCRTRRDALGAGITNAIGAAATNSGTTGINTLRIYNPVKQARDQDPDGRFVRRWLPALERLPDAWLFEPWKMPPELQLRQGLVIGRDYPEPLVDHEAAARHARDTLWRLRKEDAVRQAFHAKLFDLFSTRKGDLNIPHVQALQAEQLGRIGPAFTSLTTGFINWRDRDSHFIFGDVATAVLIEAEEAAPRGSWSILGTHLKTQFSNNIRNNFGFLNRGDEAHRDDADKLITQQGRKVFKEVVPMVSEMILQHMAALDLKPSDMRRLWLHQANSNMNRLIAERVLGHEASQDEAPTVLDVYGNTAGAGSIIAFHLNSDDLKAGDKGLICSFGAGYSAGSIFVQKAA